MDYGYFKNELIRAYRVLGAQAEAQNATDIDQWYNDGLIEWDDYSALKRLNRYLSYDY